MKQLEIFIQTLREAGNICEYLGKQEIIGRDSIMHLYKIGNIKGSITVLFYGTPDGSSFNYYIKGGRVATFTNILQASHKIALKVLEAQEEE